MVKAATVRKVKLITSYDEHTDMAGLQEKFDELKVRGSLRHPGWLRSESTADFIGIRNRSQEVRVPSNVGPAAGSRRHIPSLLSILHESCGDPCKGARDTGEIAYECRANTRPVRGTSNGQ